MGRWTKRAIAFGRSLLVLLAIATFAAYGFLVALGGRPAFGVMEAR